VIKKQKTTNEIKHKAVKTESTYLTKADYGFEFLEKLPPLCPRSRELNYRGVGSTKQGDKKTKIYSPLISTMATWVVFQLAQKYCRKIGICLREILI